MLKYSDDDLIPVIVMMITPLVLILQNWGLAKEDLAVWVGLVKGGFDWGD